MDQSEFIDKTLSFYSLYISSLAVSFTVVSAYIVALVYVIRKSGFFLKFVSFVFFTGILAQLGLFLYAGSEIFYDLLSVGQRLMAEVGKENYISGIVQLAESKPASVGVWFPWFFGVFLYLSLFHLTFFYRWKVPE